MIDAQSRYDSLFEYWGAVTGQDPWLLKAQAQAESGLNPDAVSPVGAKGLTQFMDATWAGVSGKFLHPSVWNPEQAIRAQAAYMAQLGKECPSMELTLAAYNWGIGRVRRTFLVPGIPYDSAKVPQETRQYIERILRTYAAFQKGDA
jgi:soluble lytic murein transglycosylase-like protein